MARLSTAAPKPKNQQIIARWYYIREYSSPEGQLGFGRGRSALTNRHGKGHQRVDKRPTAGSDARKDTGTRAASTTRRFRHGAATLNPIRRFDARGRFLRRP